MSVTAEARAYALSRLGVTEEQIASEVQITPQLKAIAATIRRAGQPKVTRKLVDSSSGIVVSAKGVKSVDVVEDTKHTPPYGPGSDVSRSWPWYLETSDHPEAKKVLSVYYSSFKIHRQAAPIEAFCIAARVSPLRILEVITATCVRLGVQAATIIAAVNHPRVVQKTVDMALTDEGTEDRATLHKATGFLPTPKGSHTNIVLTQNAQANASSQASAAPPPEATIRRMVNRFNDAKALPADTGSIRIPEVMPHEELEAVELESNDEDEEEEAQVPL